MAKTKADDYWEPHATILSRMKRFQKEVLEFRRTWNIPDKGLDKDDIHDWQVNLVETDPSPLSEEQQRYAGWDYWGPVVHGRFWQALTDLCISFNLDQRWIAPIYMYVLGDDELKTPYSGSVMVLPRFNDVRLPKEKRYTTEIVLKIRKDTRLNDVAAVWSEVEEYQKYMIGEPPQRRYLIQSNTVDRYVEIRDLEDGGMSHKDIAEKLGFSAAEDVSRFKADIEKRFKKPKLGSQRQLTDLWWDKYFK